MDRVVSWYPDVSKSPYGVTTLCSKSHRCRGLMQNQLTRSGTKTSPLYSSAMCGLEAASGDVDGKGKVISGAESLLKYTAEVVGMMRPFALE